MRLSGLFTVIVVTASTIAAAEPKQEEISGRVSLNEKADSKADASRQSGEWVELASPTPAKHGTELVMVGADAGAFSKLRVDATKGRTNVRKVKVFFTDGNVKTVRLDKALRQGKSVTVELGEPRTIDRVVVTTETHTKGEYALYGTVDGDVVGSR